MSELTQQFMTFVNSTLEATHVELSQQRTSASNNALEVQRLSADHVQLRTEMEQMRQQIVEVPVKGHKKPMFHTKDLRLEPYTGD